MINAIPYSYHPIIENEKIKRLETPLSKTTTKPSTDKRQLGVMKSEITLPDDIN